MKAHLVGNGDFGGPWTWDGFGWNEGVCTSVLLACS